MTSGDRLAQHYAMKYAGSADTLTAPEPIGITRFPVGRLAAAVKYLPTLAAGKDVLEIGAGDGVIPESLKAAGCDFKSYTLGDLSEVRFAALRRTLDDPRYKFAVVDGDNPRASLATEQFDVVITLDVIEHLIDPITAMAETRELLRPGGVMYLNTPNVATWTHRAELLAGRFPATASTDEGFEKYEGGPTGLRDEGHLHYFTFRSLAHMLTQRCGFVRVTPMPYHPGPTWVPTALGGRLAKARPSLFSGLAVLAHR